MTDRERRPGLPALDDAQARAELRAVLEIRSRLARQYDAATARRAVIRFTASVPTITLEGRQIPMPEAVRNLDELWRRQRQAEAAIERRALAVAEARARQRVVEREAGVAQALPRIQGLAVPVNSLSEDLGDWRERFAPSALRRVSRPESDLLLFWSHDPSLALARRSAGSLSAHVAPRGLEFAADLPPTSAGRDALELIGRGIVRAMSFAFRAHEVAWERTAVADVRTVLDASISELSPVSIPAYPATWVRVV